MISFKNTNRFIKPQPLFSGKAQNIVLLGKLKQLLFFCCFSNLRVRKESIFALSVHCVQWAARLAADLPAARLFAQVTKERKIYYGFYIKI